MRIYLDNQVSALSPAGETADAEAICAQEPIQHPGSHQPHGTMLVLDPVRALTVVAAGRDAARMLGAGEIVGRGVGETLGLGFADAVWRHFEAGQLRGEAPWRSTLRVDGGPATYDVVVHLQAGLILVELEPAGPDAAADAEATLRELQATLVDMRSAGSDSEALAIIAVHGLRRLLGYERVLIYQFDSDWNGQSIAEDKADDWDDSLNGLRFPASDIPAQARELYRRSPMRWVADREAAPTPIDGDDRHRPQTIDLSFASLRTLSPVHLQIHRNLGIDGSMSLSILYGGRLWGLVLGHHRTPHPVPAHRRLAAIALTDAFALCVGPAERLGTEQARRDGQVRLLALLAHMAQADVVAAALTSGPVTIGDLFGATGAAVVYGGEVSMLGATPPDAAVRELAAWLRSRDDGAKHFHTSNLAGVIPAWEPHSTVASGVLAAFLSADRADMLLWFRAEEPQLVSWGSGSHMRTPPPAILTPRPPFERWSGLRNGFARPWAEWELEMAETLRHSITEVIVRGLRRIGELNERLRQSQKMEAVGQLTGGLAHDFNNLLAGISGSLELMRSRVAQGRVAEVDRYIGTAMISANRAASLVHRLLAFSRRQTLDPKSVDVNRLTASMEDLIRRTVGPEIHVETVIAGGLWRTLCDANQLENALLNLAINARDAMPAGGRLTIEATNAWLDDDYVSRNADVVAGQYVAVSVTDTGVGMGPDVVARVFEPFFTTKPLGEGTGLGLSMVYGFAKQSDGHASVYSEVGQGTTVRLYLPRAYGNDDGDIDADSLAPAQTDVADKTVLVVDDEPVVRMLVADVLRDLGYGVIEAIDGAEGLRVLRSRRVDLLVSDVGLPGGMNGRQLADAARVRWPGLKVLFITGYAENAAIGNGLLEPGTQVLTKPFPMLALTAKIRAMMG